MSFFGFNTSLPRDRPASGTDKGFFEHANPFNEVAKARKLQAFQNNEDDVIDFEDTYDGLGDQLNETGDDFNDDTFGGGQDTGTARGAVGRDFDFFGQTARVADAFDEEQVRYHLQDPSQSTQSTSTANKPKKTGYEKYQDPGYIPDIQAKSSAWSSRVQNAPPSQDDAQPSLISTSRNATTNRRIMSLEEVEAAMRGQGQPPQQHPHDPYAYQMHQGPPPGQPQFTMPGYPPQVPFNPVQAPNFPQMQSPPRHNRMPPQQAQQPPQQPPLQILQNPNRARHSPQPSFDQQPKQAPGPLPNQPVLAPPQQLMDLSEEQRRAYLEEDAKRAKRNHKIFLLSKGNGLMTPQDKNFITRIQLQQLVTATGSVGDQSSESALAEDFYYQVYSQIRGAPRQHPTQPLGHFAQTYLLQTRGRMGGNRKNVINGDNHMQRMQQQVQRAVEAAKLKPKNKQLIIEGSLGKISFSNAKTPKPLLNLKRQESSDTRPSSARRNVNVEDGSDRKTVLRNIEKVYTDLMRLEDHERRLPPPPQEGNADAVQAHIEWRQELASLNTSLWQDLKVLDPIVPGSLVIHPFIAFLSFAKGKKAIPRVFRLIDQEQRVTMLTMIVVHLDQLDVVRNGRTLQGESQPAPQIREDIDLFSQTVMPCLLGYVSEAPINIMIGLLGLIIDHTNAINVMQTKVGLGMLTMLLSRGELVKETGTVNEQDTQQWSTLYDRFFDVVEQVLGVIFPGPVNSGDDVYVWQFLAAMGIGASPEQQQRLVIGVKDRVMETVAQSKTLPADMSSLRLGNVNLFMRAIGLDVEMLG